MIRLLRWILLPFTLIYQFIIWFRNLLYDYNILSSQKYSIPTIVIGNLAVGGAGKSPMTEYLIRLLKDKYKLATLSRGYGRKTKGFKIVDSYSKAIEVGDEPLQFKNKFPDITVAVDENRCEGVEFLQDNHQLIILDDAYQHRKLAPGFSLLLFDYKSLFGPKILLPTGNFRDIFSSSKRADIIIITKCPQHIPEEKKQYIEQQIHAHNRCPIFYSKISYSQPINAFTKEQLSYKFKDSNIVLFSGIANPKPLIDFLNEDNTVKTINFSDHHNYTAKDFDNIIDVYNKQNANAIIVTTEKDIQRVDISIFNGLPLFYIPIQMEFLYNENTKFNQIIENYINTQVSIKPFDS